MTTRPIDANSFAVRVGLYMAENAYLNDTALDVLKKVSNWLEEEPIIDCAPVKHGQWEHFNPNDKNAVSCSACDYSFGRIFPANYCPNCGARMDGKEDN